MDHSTSIQRRRLRAAQAEAKEESAMVAFPCASIARLRPLLSRAATGAQRAQGPAHARQAHRSLQIVWFRLAIGIPVQATAPWSALLVSEPQPSSPRRPLLAVPYQRSALLQDTSLATMQRTAMLSSSQRLTPTVKH